MNTYIERDKRDCEMSIRQLIRDFELKNKTKVDGINFIRQSMCNTDGQKIKTLDVVLDCR